MLARVGVFFEMIKISHTLFALPFAIGAAFLAAGGLPDPLLGLKIVAAVFFARTAAMSFNRWADRDIDGRNPRTETRAIPAGALSPGFVLAATIASVAGFVAVAATINELALWLSPVAVVVVLGYSLTKRFTRWCHVVLGAALALAPIGAWVAIRGTIDPEAWILGASVCLWTAGFDVLYSTMDAKFDVEAGLHSLPSRVGVKNALRIAALLHIGMVALLVTLGVVAELGLAYSVATGIVATLLVAEHWICRPERIETVAKTFLPLNAMCSATVMVGLVVEAVG